MSYSRSILAYADISALFERASKSPNGVRVHFDSMKERNSHMFRCYTFRMLDRSNNKILYPLGHTMHGTSFADVFQLRKVGDKVLEVWRVVPIDDAKIEEI